MTTDSVGNIPVTMWSAIALGLVALALILHAVFPRYEWRMVDTNGNAIMVYDRWSGEFQRTVYQEDGTIKGMHVYRPF